LAFGGDEEGGKARRRDVNESGVVNKSRDLINKDASHAFLHKIMIILLSFGEQKCGAEYFGNYHIFLRILCALVVESMLIHN
jgi:hypothetical protein